MPVDPLLLLQYSQAWGAVEEILGGQKADTMGKNEFLLLNYLRNLIKFYFAAINTKRGYIAKSQATFSSI